VGEFAGLKPSSIPWLGSLAVN
jgi:hypothetical protein